MTKKSRHDWQPTKAACEALNISRDHLWRLRADMKEGKHYRNIGRKNAVRPTYQWNIPAIEALLNQPQAKRA